MARPRQVTDEAILETARACVLAQGPGVSLDAVAERLGVSGPALLKRFGSRQALMIAALRPSAMPPWMDVLGEPPTAAPLCEQLHALFERILAFFAQEVPRMSALCESGIPLSAIFDADTAPPPVQGARALADWISRARDLGLVEGEDFETTASAMLGALQGRVFSRHLFKRAWWKRTEREFLSDLATLFSRALAPSQASNAGDATHIRSQPAVQSARRPAAIRSARGNR